jgi:hypothetical protein
MYMKEEKESHSDEVNGNNHHRSTSITDKQHEDMKHSQHYRQQNHHQEPISNQYNVNLHFDSIVPEAGRKTVLTISVAENQELLSEISNWSTISLCILSL